MQESVTGSGSVFERLADARLGIIAQSTADRVANVLRTEIAEGRLRSGMQLPEQQLGGALAVSRNTVREALTQLIGERILVRENHRGVFVATPDAESVRDIYRVRCILEPAVLREVRPDSALAHPLRAAVTEGQQAAAANDGDAVGSANQHFHRALVALAGSPRLDHQMSLLLAEMRLAFHQVGGSHPYHLPYITDNDAVCVLIEQGDPEGAAQRLHDYLDRACADLLAAISDP